MDRIAAIDFGTVRIGMALSDESKFLATPLPYIPAVKDLRANALAVLKALSEHSLKEIVLGLPLHMDGKESPLSMQVRLFAEALRGFSNLRVILWDERLTTAQVEKSLKDSGVKRKNRTQKIDSLTAALILQNYLDSNYGS